MRVSPVRKVRKPGYPTKSQAVGQPNLLLAHQPPAWRACRELAGAVALFLAAETFAAQPSKSTQAKPALVAPVFHRGEGRAGDGCMIVNPPVYLPEENALQIIREELAKSGLVFSETDVTMPGVKIAPPWTDEERKEAEKEQHQAFPQSMLEAKPFIADLEDTKNSVVVEYISAGDEGNYGKPTLISVYTVETTNVAEHVRNQVAAHAQGITFGVFYDPIAVHRSASPEVVAKLDAIEEEADKDIYSATDLQERARRVEKYNARREQALAPYYVESARLLRQQVKDFADWLKAQGVI